MHELAVGGDVREHVGERAAVPREAQARPQPFDLLQRAQELPHGVGCEAVVEVQRDAPQQVVSGYEQAPLGLEQAYVRRRVTGRLVHAPSAEVGVDLQAREQCPVGLDDARDARVARAPLGRVAAQGLLGNPALAGDLDAPFEHRLGVFGHAPHVLVVGVHPQLAPGQLDDRGRLAIVIGVRVSADDQARVLEPQPTHRKRALEVRKRVGLVHAGVEQHEPSIGGHRPCVAVRHAWPRQRQAQAKDARQHALAPPQLALGRGSFPEGASLRRRGLHAMPVCSRPLSRTLD